MEEEREHTQLNEKKWDRVAEKYDELIARHWFHFTQKRVLSLLNEPENQRLLDMGCGTGWAVRYLASLPRNSGEFYGVDISSRMIEIAEGNCAGHENAHFYRADAAALPFEGDFFDSIVCTSSFHHYFSPSRVLDEVYRVLKPGGKVYIMDVTADGFIVNMSSRWTRKREREFVKYYSTREYRALFTKAKLSYVASRLMWPLVKVHIAEKTVIGTLTSEQDD